jgi:hypothetical protein
MSIESQELESLLVQIKEANTIEAIQEKSVSTSTVCKSGQPKGLESWLIEIGVYTLTHKNLDESLQKYRPIYTQRIRHFSSL